MWLSDLAYPACEELLTRRPVALWPLGAVEPHGPHGPLSTDTLISIGICNRAAPRLADIPAVVLPPLHYGVTRFSAGFAGAVGISETTLGAFVAEVAGSLLDQGVRAVVVVNNHFEPVQVRALRTATGDAGVVYFDVLRRQYVERLPHEFQSGACHAGRYETSLVLADAPGLVDTEVMAVLPSLQVNLASEIADGKTDFESMGLSQAYCGAPAEASATEGEATFDTLATMLVELVEHVVTHCGDDLPQWSAM